jgi:hypothetical protein
MVAAKVGVRREEKNGGQKKNWFPGNDGSRLPGASPVEPRATDASVRRSGQPARTAQETEEVTEYLRDGQQRCAGGGHWTIPLSRCLSPLTTLSGDEVSQCLSSGGRHPCQRRPEAVGAAPICWRSSRRRMSSPRAGGAIGGRGRLGAPPP